MIRRVLVANRGEIAVRVLRACRAEGLETVAVYSEADRHAMHVRLADRAVCIGPPPASRSYLDMAALVAVGLGTGCDAVHPGYGFLSEKAAFARACTENGLTFVGPGAEAIDAMGDKERARGLAVALGLPVVPGADLVPGDLVQAEAAAAGVGFPLMIKAAAGGGGRGIRVVREAAEFGDACVQACAEAEKAFGDGRVYLERYLEDVRHVEVQVLADHAGQATALGERDCSIQRRHQKLLEESPCVELADAVRARMQEAALAIVKAIGYRNAGTVEFLLDRSTGEFYFIEMNTRIQVEHPVTEMRFGIDLVRAQLRIASGAGLHECVPSAPDRVPSGHAIECRINAEDPDRSFAPSPGVIERFDLPIGEGVRIDTHCFEGCIVPPYYDSLLAKLVVLGATREAAVDRLRAALAGVRIEGVRSTLPLHRRIAEAPDFLSGDVNTRWVEERFLAPRPSPA